ncbi:MAG: hypothetical protein ABJG15_04675 [Hyphomonadaceae bacterium]
MLGHISHADISLTLYRDEPGDAYQTTNSNRTLLYSHPELPILVPDRLYRPGVPSIIGYYSPPALARCETWKLAPGPAGLEGTSRMPVSERRARTARRDLYASSPETWK